MPNMELITSVTVGSGGAASVTLPATGTIPQTYTDLKVVMSVRDNSSAVGNNIFIKVNGVTTNQSMRFISGDGSSTPNSASDTPIYVTSNGNTSTSNTFSNIEVYIPNYTSTTTYKSLSIDSVSENNGTTAYAQLAAGLYSSNTAITTISFSTNGSATILEGSTFYLYGISNVTSTTKATGGIVSSDGTYNYHMFPFSGTFTPTEAISADVLCIAGGGGGGGERTGAGAGAGGLLYFSSQSLTATGYTVTVGAGGAGGNAVLGTVGADSQFGSLTLVKGGGLGGAGADAGSGFNGGNGGSGGGGGGWGANGTAGSPTSGQGNSGSAGQGAPNYPSGAGGGAGAAGQTITGSSTKCADGGIGTNTYSSFAIATQTGVNGYYAGGGGGGGNPIPIPNGIGGLGGGGDGGANTFDGNRGLTNTGGGGGGSGKWTSGVGGNGGSGLVIIRYAI
jgi:hypothetical protein